MSAGKGNHRSLFQVSWSEQGLSGTLPEAEAAVLFLTVEAVGDGQLPYPALQGVVRDLSAKGMFAGRRGEVYCLPSFGSLPMPYIVLAGLGEQPVTSHALREAAVHAAKAAAKHKLAGRLLYFPAAVLQTCGLRAAGHAAAEGTLLGHYRIRSSQSGVSALPAELPSVHLLLQGRPRDDAEMEFTLGVEEGAAYAEGAIYARDLVNTPSNRLEPADLAAEAVKLSSRFGFACQVLDEKEIREQGMGGLWAVGKGSAAPPRMIVIRYQGKEHGDEDVLGLIGKGITFDTGGISIKKSEGMEEMISDMGGAAVVLGAMLVIGLLQPAANVLAVIPAAENMPSDRAYKPGDVITTLSGKTVEVLNTDAEGRIVLADGVTYAKQLGAGRIIDVATLTGAVLVALGDVATAAVTNNEKFLSKVLQAAERAGEKVWQLPAYPEYREQLRSAVADLTNSGGRWAGAITGGLFIGEFAGDTPWIHLDTGGTAWLWDDKGTEPKGGTGSMVRTLAEFIRSET